MSRNTVRMIALFTAFPDKIDEFRNFLNQVVGPALKSAGCLAYELQQSLTEANGFHFIEEWNGRITFDHLQRAHLPQGLSALGEFVTVGPDMRRE